MGMQLQLAVHVKLKWDRLEEKVKEDYCAVVINDSPMGVCSVRLIEKNNLEAYKKIEGYRAVWDYSRLVKFITER